mmetsp:Transcript_674/g.1922  ORF Transcript_674/g.1922 Transcript_674/m.1922 type:complete len:203 (+) Transcript_674:976-1584(+)
MCQTSPTAGCLASSLMLLHVSTMLMQSWFIFVILSMDHSKKSGVYSCSSTFSALLALASAFEAEVWRDGPFLSASGSLSLVFASPGALVVLVLGLFFTASSLASASALASGAASASAALGLALVLGLALGFDSAPASSPAGGAGAGARASLASSSLPLRSRRASSLLRLALLMHVPMLRASFMATAPSPERPPVSRQPASTM